MTARTQNTPLDLHSFLHSVEHSVVAFHRYDRRCISMVPMLPVSSRTSKSRTSSFVSSVPLRLPTAHTSFVLLHRIRHTTPPLLPLSSATRLRRNSPVRKSQIFTVPSSLDVITNVLLNCRHVTALWCLLGPEDKHCQRHTEYFVTVMSKYMSHKVT